MLSASNAKTAALSQFILLRLAAMADSKLAASSSAASSPSAAWSGSGPAKVDPLCGHSIIFFHKNGSLGIVQACDLLDKFFMANDLAYGLRIDPEQIGLDPCNRDETGWNYMDVHALLSDIKVVGWSDAATKACCVCRDFARGPDY